MADFTTIHRLDIALHAMMHRWLDERNWGDRQTAECQCGKRWTT